MEDMSSNIVSIRTIGRIEGSPVKEADRPSLRGFRSEPTEKGAEARVGQF